MKSRYLLLLLPVLLFGCNKKQDAPNATDPANQNFAYSVKVAPSISSAQNSIYHLAFNIKVLSGDIGKNKLTCTVEGLPPSVFVSPASMVVSHLLGGVFTLDIRTLAIGDYHFLLKIKSDKYGTETHSVVLKIVSATDYAPILAGVYDSCYDNCSDSGLIYYASQVSVVADTPFLLKLTNIKKMGAGVIVRAWVSKNITIPVQEVDGKTIWGSGTYSQDARPGHGGDYMMMIKDTIVSGLDTVTCTAHIEH